MTRCKPCLYWWPTIPYIIISAVILTRYSHPISPNKFKDVILSVGSPDSCRSYGDMLQFAWQLCPWRSKPCVDAVVFVDPEHLSNTYINLHQGTRDTLTTIRCKTKKWGGSDVVWQRSERWKTCTGCNSQTNLPTHEVGDKQCRAKRSVAMRRGMAQSATLTDK